MGKKRWQKPELIVLERGKPEEAVLLACKITGKSSGSGTYNSRCYYHKTTCAACSSPARS